MYFQLLAIICIIFLTACQGNSQSEELSLSPMSKEVETADDGTDDGTDDFPEVECVSAHSPNNPVIQPASNLNYLFYETLDNDFFNYHLTDDSSTKLLDGSNNIPPYHYITPYQYLTGESLSGWQSQTRGFFLASDKLLFANPISGQLDQVSNLDLTGRRICKATQRHTSFVRMAELDIQLGKPNSSCDINLKVDLSLGANDDFNILPSLATEQGLAIYNSMGSWQGNLLRRSLNGSPVLAFVLPDMCSVTTLFEFEQVTDTWSGIQQADGSLLLRLGNKVFFLEANDALDFVKQKNNYVLPSTPELVLTQFTGNDWIVTQGGYIYFTDESNKGFYSHKILDNSLSALQLLADEEAEEPEQFVKFVKMVVDNDSVWIEGMYSIQVDLLNDAGELIRDEKGIALRETEYRHRFLRWDIASQNLDASAQFSHVANTQFDRTVWYSVRDKLYVKTNPGNSLVVQAEVDAEDYHADYLLQKSTSPLKTTKIWQFMQSNNRFGKDINSVLSIDFSGADNNQYQLEFINDTAGNIDLGSISNSLYVSSIDRLQGDYILLANIDCQSDCSDRHYEYQVKAININNNSRVGLFSKSFP
jgi:hypothetical protein